MQAPWLNKNKYGIVAIVVAAAASSSSSVHVPDIVASSMRALAETPSGRQRAPDQRRCSRPLRLPSHPRHPEPELPGVPGLPGAVPVQPAPGAVGPPGPLPGLRSSARRQEVLHLVVSPQETEGPPTCGLPSGLMRGTS